MAEYQMSIYDEIGEDLFGGLSAAAFKEQFNSFKAGRGDVVTVCINSPGGSLWDGVAIYNTLKLSPARCVIRIEGIALSCAGFIAMAGDEVQIVENGMFMMHEGWLVAIGNCDELRTIANMLEKTTREVLIPTYSAKSRKRPDTIAKMLAKDGGFGTWMSAAECKEEGFADTILKTTKSKTLGEGGSLKSEFDVSAFPGLSERLKAGNVPECVKNWVGASEPVHWRRLAAKRRLDLDAQILDGKVA